VTTLEHDQAAGTLPIPEGEHPYPGTPREELDAALDVLSDRARAWTEVGLERRLELIRELVDDTLVAAPEWCIRAAEARGVARDSPLMSEEWGYGVLPLVRCLKGFERTLEDIRRTGRPQPPSLEVAPNGQVVARVYPTDWVDRVVFAGFTAEARLQPGVTLDQARAAMGRIYRPGHVSEPGVTVVLGAGNVAGIAPTDALHHLFALDRVVLLKLNPVNEYMGPHLAEAFQALIREGFLRIAYGGEDTGAYLTEHDKVTAIHVTGSDKTHDAIVFGTGEQGARRKAAGEPRNHRELTSELGNVTPVIVVPGPWSDGDLAFHGESIASMLVQNAGFNCVAARMIVQHRAWSKRRALLDAVRASLRAAEPRLAFYPGSRDRWELFVETHRTAEWFSEPRDGEVPFTLIPDIDPEARDDITCRTEAFCGVMSEVGLDAPRSVPEYLDAAVRYCNETLWGTLAVTIIVHPRSLADPMVADAVERAVADLRYGTVAINQWSGVSFALMTTPWGAYPGSDPTDIQSGRGFVHNTFLLEDVEKAVMRAPFRIVPKPLWFHTHRTQATEAALASRLVATRDPRLLPALAWAAGRG
jgi:hypothetical protein